MTTILFIAAENSTVYGVGGNPKNSKKLIPGGRWVLAFLSDMTGFKESLKHAFAVDRLPAGLERALPEPLERLAAAVVARGMETPAIILLDTIRPLNFLLGQSMLAAWPLVKMAAQWDDYKNVAEALEDRRMIGKLAARIEELAFDKGARA